MKCASHNEQRFQVSETYHQRKKEEGEWHLIRGLDLIDKLLQMRLIANACHLFRRQSSAIAVAAPGSKHERMAVVRGTGLPVRPIFGAVAISRAQYRTLLCR